MRMLYKASGDDQLFYWGFSYGTVLGSVFSDMFPEEVGRVVLDGTVDVPNYMAGNWSDNLLDAQGTYEKGFLGECAKAGDKCALNKVAKGTDLKILLDDFQNTLIAEPMISTLSNATLLDYSTLKGAIFSSLYATYAWPNITAAIAKAIEGNATDFLNAYGGSGQGESSPQAFVAIAGGDSLVRREHVWDLNHYEVRQTCRRKR
jgi:pimeloyl-ACP methyl ester carboxylesterase